MVGTEEAGRAMVAGVWVREVVMALAVDMAVEWTPAACCRWRLWPRMTAA